MIRKGISYTVNIIKKDIFKLTILLFLYIILILIFSNRNHLFNDEIHYWQFAENLTNGFYSPSDPINLWCGPGYPLVLLPFSFLNIPHIFAKLLNAFFYFFSIVFFYKSLLLLSINKKKSLIFSYLLGLYIPLFYYLFLNYTEIFSFFLISIVTYYLIKLLKNPELNFKYIILSGFLLAFLALTKIIFGYVLIICFIIYLLAFLIKRKRRYAKMLLIFFISLCFCLPYLIYTYSLTNKIFYWGNSGGLSLYWMSTPFKYEYGDWQPHDLRGNKKLEKNHKPFFDKIKDLSSIKKDEELRKKAIKNILDNPGKYILNICTNMGRMIFSYPYSYGRHQTLAMYDLVLIIPNCFLFVFSFIGGIFTIKFYKKINFLIKNLLVFILIYLLLSSFVSAYARQLMIMLPAICIWLVFIFKKIDVIKLNF